MATTMLLLVRNAPKDMAQVGAMAFVIGMMYPRLVIHRRKDAECTENLCAEFGLVMIIPINNHVFILSDFDIPLSCVYVFFWMVQIDASHA